MRLFFAELASTSAVCSGDAVHAQGTRDKATDIVRIPYLIHEKICASCPQSPLSGLPSKSPADFHALLTLRCPPLSILVPLLLDRGRYLRAGNAAEGGASGSNQIIHSKDELRGWVFGGVKGVESSAQLHPALAHNRAQEVG